AALRRLWLHPRERPGSDGRRGRRPRAERGRQGVLPGVVVGGAEELSRCETLSPPQAPAGVIACPGWPISALQSFMNIDALRKYCAMLPGTTRDIKWGADEV